MRETDAVWRTLADAALVRRREWKNTGDLAWEAGVGQKIAYKALLRLTEIGAVTRYPAGGFSVTDPERVLTMFAAARTLRGATTTQFAAAQRLATESSIYAIGGTRAAVHHLGGRNSIAVHAPAILYVPEDAPLSNLPQGDDALGDC